MPNILNLIISYMTNGEEGWKGYVYMVAIVTLNLGKTISFTQYLYGLSVAGMRMRTALTCAIYSKALKLSQRSLRSPSDSHECYLGQAFL